MLISSDMGVLRSFFRGKQPFSGCRCKIVLSIIGKKKQPATRIFIPFHYIPSSRVFNCFLRLPPAFGAISGVRKIGLKM
jgi:hypothetical protein